MCRACRTHRIHEKWPQFWSENLKGRDNLEDLVVDGRTTLKWNLKKYDSVH
jgi:hypothetical protein